MNLYGSICLDDIPAEAIETSQKNGKRYVRISINERREVDQYGNSHNVKVNYRPDPADPNQGPFYIGDLKTSTFNAQAQPQVAPAPVQAQYAAPVQPQPQAQAFQAPAGPQSNLVWDPVTGQYVHQPQVGPF